MFRVILSTLLLLCIASVSRAEMDPAAKQKLYNDTIPSLVAVKYTWEHEMGRQELIGAGVVVIDHDLGFITGICDRITCLDQGEIIATGTPDEVRRDPRVMSAYLGTQA